MVRYRSDDVEAIVNVCEKVESREVEEVESIYTVMGAV